MTDLIVRAPRYLARFACLGSRCEDNCCAGWQNVDVDLATYQRYQHTEHPDLGPALRRHIRVNDEPGAGPEEFALVSIPDGGGCPFFNSEGLCAIQAALGEELLPAGCDTFPRQATLVEGTLELAGRLACPEVTRLALLAPDALELVEVEPERRLRERPRYWVEVPWGDLPAGDPRQYYHLIRRHCRELLGRREVSLEARLQALGRALGPLDQWPSLAGSEIEAIFGQVAAQLPSIQADLDGRPPPSGPPTLLLERLRPWVAMPGVPARYGACLDRLRDGLRLPVEATIPLAEGVAEAYRAARPLFLAYTHEKPHVLENVLVNYLLVTSSPFHRERTFYEEYALLACRYGLLALHLIGAAAAEGSLTDALVVETVQAFDKYGDSPDYWQRTLNLLRRAHALNHEGLAELLVL